MKITKFAHACLMVEMPERTAIFDPGGFAEQLLRVDSLQYLDDIIITHKHGDHSSDTLLRALVAKFPEVRITSTPEVVAHLHELGIAATDQESPGIKFFDSPHEAVEPMFEACEEIGVHYLDRLTHPGDSHTFTTSMPVLALPVDGPWGAAVPAVKLALELRPKFVIPIHDWFWSDAARQMHYDGMHQLFAHHGIEFIVPKDGEPFTVSI